MRIWHLDCDVDNYENLTWKDNLDIEDLQSYDGRKKSQSWKPIKVERMYNREFSNMPGLSSHIPILDIKAVEILKDLIKENVEILSLDCPEGEFYAINITTVVDCIDYKNSEYRTYRDGKRIMVFTKYSFVESLVKDKHIFKITDEPLRMPFVSDEFRRRVINSNLTGFVFELVWDSEA